MPGRMQELHGGSGLAAEQGSRSPSSPEGADSPPPPASAPSYAPPPDLPAVVRTSSGHLVVSPAEDTAGPADPPADALRESLGDMEPGPMMGLEEGAAPGPGAATVMTVARAEYPDAAFRGRVARLHRLAEQRGPLAASVSDSTVSELAEVTESLDGDGGVEHRAPPSPSPSDSSTSTSAHSCESEIGERQSAPYQ